MIVFDAGGTLIGADWPRVTKDMSNVAARHGLSVGTEAIRNSFRETWRDVLLGVIPDQADSPQAVTRFWHHLLAHTLDRASATSPRGALNHLAWRVAVDFYPQFDAGDYHQLIEGAHSALSALSDAGFRLGMLSNWSPRLPDVLERLGIRPFFETVVVSSLVGLAKPDRAIFHLVEELAGCRPHQLLYVGDSPSADVVGSKAAGWDVVLVSRGDPALGAASDADAVIHNISDLPSLLTPC
jgi:putative hydrolase of the HAD superfamily